jgi:hypothetical protein
MPIIQERLRLGHHCEDVVCFHSVTCAVQSGHLPPPGGLVGLVEGDRTIYHARSGRGLGLELLFSHGGEGLGDTTLFLFLPLFPSFFFFFFAHVLGPAHLAMQQRFVGRSLGYYGLRAYSSDLSAQS